MNKARPAFEPLFFNLKLQVATGCNQCPFGVQKPSSFSVILGTLILKDKCDKHDPIIKLFCLSQFGVSCYLLVKV